MKKKMILQRLWYLLCWIALMQLGFVNAYASEVVRKNYKIGLAPSHVTTSPNSFLKNTSEWAFVAKQIDFYKYYGVQFGGLSQFTSIDPQKLLLQRKKRSA